MREEKAKTEKEREEKAKWMVLHGTERKVYLRRGGFCELGQRTRRGEYPEEAIMTLLLVSPESVVRDWNQPGQQGL